VKGTWRKGSLAADRKALETDISLHKGPAGEPGMGLIYQGLREMEEGALGTELLSL